jgi:general nucleoside transport system ATP-binding protein
MSADPAAAVAVRMTGIHKRFGAVRANEAVNLSVAAGSVHALVGENGAGKSTLMSVLYGTYAPDSGAIEVFGQRAALRSTHDAIALGLGMVHQHFMLVDNLTALENVMLGAEPGFLLGPAEAAVRPRLLQLMASTGLRVDLDARCGDLPVGDRRFAARAFSSSTSPRPCSRPRRPCTYSRCSRGCASRERP